MEYIDQINYYAVKQDLSVIPSPTLEHCFQYEDIMYAIVEKKGTRSVYLNGHTFERADLDIQLFDKEKRTFLPEDNSWKIVALNIIAPAPLADRTTISIDIADPRGNIQTVTSEEGNYKGIIQLHRLLRYVSNNSDWEIGDRYKNKMELKKIFVRLKNGHEIRQYIDIDGDKYYTVDLSYKNGIYQMTSYITDLENEHFGDIWDLEKYENEDFYIFMAQVIEKFPTIRLPVQ